jgi:hypothetical protein
VFEVAKQPTDANETNGVSPPLSAEDEQRSLVLTRDLVIRLFGRLNHAFNESPDLPVTVENERQRLVVALWSIAAFLGKGGFDLPFAHRFFELGSSIEDLSLGIQGDLLKPVPQGSRRPADRAGVWQARACVALALEALTRAGRTRETAAKEIARRFPDVGKLINSKRSTGGSVPKTIIEWRKKLPSVKNWQVNEFYAFGGECIEALAASNSASDRLVQFANDMSGRAAQSGRLRVPSPKSREAPGKKSTRPASRGPKGRFQV